MFTLACAFNKTIKMVAPRRSKYESDMDLLDVADDMDNQIDIDKILAFKRAEEADKRELECDSEYQSQFPSTKHAILSTIEFNDSGDRITAVGKLVPSGSNRAAGSTMRNLQNNSESEVSINRARSILLSIASHTSLSLDKSLALKGLLYYKMALHHGLTRSRCTAYVAVACLYIVCRLNATRHLLIDFAEVTKSDVFVLGRIYRILCRNLSVAVPVIDPCLFVERYGFKLKMGSKTRDICHTAVRLVGRMKRDWIHLGRRPNGLCGAALLVAGQLHGMDISVHRMVNTVKISKSVLMKRMSDVENTPTALLTLEDLFSSKIENQIEQDPPSLVKSRENYTRRAAIENELCMLDQRVIDMVVKTKQEMDVVMGIRDVIQMGINDTQNISTNIVCDSETTPTESVPFKIKEMDPDPQFDSDDNDLADVDDEEIENSILSPEEVEVKTRIWMSENAEYLRQKEERHKQMERMSVGKKKRKASGVRRRKMMLSDELMDELVSTTTFKRTRTTPQEIDDISEDGNRVKLDDNIVHQNKEYSTGDNERQMTANEFIDLVLDPKRSQISVDREIPEQVEMEDENDTGKQKKIIKRTPEEEQIHRRKQMFCKKFISDKSKPKQNSSVSEVVLLKSFNKNALADTLSFL